DIDLQRAADAGRPQSGVAHDTLRERRLGDDVRDGQATAWLEHTRRLPEDATLVRRQVDDAVADHAVGGAGFGRDLLDVALSVVDSTEAVSIAQPLGLASLGIRHVYADHRARAADVQGGDDGIDARPAAQVHDAIPRRQPANP